ncbi:tetratricopeptide repeat protein [Larkinella punicea]|nr:tetratricopeptide repeat protein [Larkinella punicea]
MSNPSSNLVKAIVSGVGYCLTHEEVAKAIPGAGLVTTIGLGLANAIAPNFVHQFTCDLSYNKLRERFAHPSELNHNLENLLKDAAVRSVSFLKRLYLDQLGQETDLSFFEKHFEQNPIRTAKEVLETMERDLQFWVKHETIQSGLLENPEDCLTTITDYLFVVSRVDESLAEWQKLRTFFAEKLPTCFELAFKEALQNDDKGFRSFQIWMLEEIQEQNRAILKQIQEGRELLLAEIRTLKNGETGQSTAVLQQFAEETTELKQILRDNHAESVGYFRRIIELLEKPAITYPRELNNFSAFSGEFVGRVDELTELAQKLETSQRVVLMNGLGGIGKTTLARKFMQQHKLAYQHVLWVEIVVPDVKTQTADDLLNAFVLDPILLGNLRLKLPERVDTTVFFSQIMNVLRNLSGPNLLIIDNASTELADRAIRDLLPGPPNWQVLVTSRQKLSGFDLIRLDKLDPEAARTLFRTLYTYALTGEELDELLVVIDHHTLTIELAAKTLENHYGLVSVAELTEKYKSKQLDDPDLQARIETEHSREETEIFIHLMQTFDLSALSDDEKWVMKQFAVLPPEAYPQEQLMEWLQLTDQKEQRKFAGNLQSLEKKGWLQRKDLVFSIHRLIQQVVHYQLQPGFEDVKLLVDTLTGFLHSDVSTNTINLFSFLPVADFLLACLSEDDLKQSQISTLKNNAGIIFSALGDYNRARDLLEAALASDLTNFGKDHPTVAVRQSNLATVYRDLGDYNRARDLLEAALASALTNFGKDHPTVAVSQSNLARVYSDLGDYNRARDLLEAALASDLTNFGKDHPTVAVRQSNLATVYSDLGDYNRARDLLEAALASDLTNFGKDHPTVAVRQSNLANVYRDLGDYNRARDLLEAALASALTNFGKDHPTVAVRQSNLANVYSALGDYNRARDLLEAALASDLTNFGKDHPTVAVRQSNLATVYRALGDYNRARDLLEAALASDLTNFGKDHPNVAVRYNNLGHVWIAMKNWVEAKHGFEKALEIGVKAWGANHPNMSIISESLAFVEEQIAK